MKRRGRHVFIPLYSTLSVLGSFLIVVFLFVAQKLAEHNIHFYINYRGITTGKMYVVAVWLQLISAIMIACVIRICICCHLMAL